MAVRQSSGRWKAPLCGVVWAYGISFVAGLVFYAIGLTPETDQVLYLLLAFLAGALGVAVALRVMGAVGLAQLVALGVGLWFLNLIGVVVGAQTLTEWFASSLFIAATVGMGRMLLGNSLPPLPAAGSAANMQNR
ncbi:MAG: hypothetical protein MRJ68_08530 [Nitrospira sp.]|nr:hypothetical protein [Nitrospira sp.]